MGTEERHLIVEILFFTLFTLVVPGALWYFGITRRKPQLKTWAVVVFMVPLLMLGYILLAEQLGWNRTTTYQTTVTGPPPREPVASTEIPYHANHEGWKQVVEMTPEARSGESATGTVTLKFEARAPHAAQVANAQGTVGVDKGKMWSTFRTEFVAPEEGSYTLKLEIPHPVGGVRLKIREVRP